jgi:hypothetical protein
MTTDLPWNAPRGIPGPWGLSDYHWVFATDGRETAEVYRYLPADGGRTLLATITNDPATSGPEMVVTVAEGTELAGHVGAGTLLSGAGLHYLAKLTVMYDRAISVGAGLGAEAAARVMALADVAVCQLAVDLEVTDERWSEHFAPRRNPTANGVEVDRLFTRVDCHDASLTRLGVPEPEQGKIQAALVTVWAGAYLDAYEQGVKSCAAEKIRNARDETRIVIGYAERTEISVTVAELRKAIATRLVDDPRLVDELARVHDADPAQLAAIAADSAFQLREWLLSKRATGSGAVVIESAGVVIGEDDMRDVARALREGR